MVTITRMRLCSEREIQTMGRKSSNVELFCIAYKKLDQWASIVQYFNGLFIASTKALADCANIILGIVGTKERKNLTSTARA